MTTKDLVGALDQGTTSTRFLLFDRSGETVSSHQLEHRQIFPKPGWVEHDPVEIRRNTVDVVAGALKRGVFTPGICEELALSEGADRFRGKTGLPIATYFSGPKIKWILDNVRGVRDAAEGGALRAGLLRPGEREKYLRDRMLSAHEHWDRSRCFP